MQRCSPSKQQVETYLQSIIKNSETTQIMRVLLDKKMQTAYHLCLDDNIILADCMKSLITTVFLLPTFQ